MSLTQERLKEMLHYDRSTGVFTWLKRNRKSTNVVVGSVAGSQDKRYRTITVDGKKYSAHRVAWLYETGAFPVGQIDHWNGIKKDNRFDNLRDVSGSINQQNQRCPQRSNSSGFMGVVPVRKRFRAQIWFDGAAKNLGTYDAAEDAHAAYLVAKRKFHEGCTI